VGSCRKDEQISATACAGVKFVSHVPLKKPISVAVNEQNGVIVPPQGFLCRPDGRNQEIEELRNPRCPGGLPERRVARAEDEAIGFHLLENCGSDTGAK
jgi:hypothetical protein